MGNSKAIESNPRVALKKDELFSKKWYIGHARRVAILVLNVLFNNIFSLTALGILNRLFGRPLHTIFVAYPEKEEYAIAYVYKKHRKYMRWKPWLAGLFLQNGKLGLTTVISSTGDDFFNENDQRHNFENLRSMVDATERLKSLLGAHQKTFAGILPGVLVARRILRNSPEIDVTVHAVTRAEEVVRNTLHYGESTPIIVLGGRGFVGREVVKRLSENGRDVYSVDILPGHKINHESWPTHLTMRPAILINLTKKIVLEHYKFSFWKGLVFLNETYPAPPKEELEYLAGIGCPAFHIVGVRAKTWPSFPKEYNGAIPCCAAWGAHDMEVMIKSLN